MNKNTVLQILTGKKPKQQSSLHISRTNHLLSFKNYKYIFRYSYIQVSSSQFSQYHCLILCFCAFRNFATKCNYICRTRFAAEAVLIYAMPREIKQAPCPPVTCCHYAHRQEQKLTGLTVTAPSQPTITVQQTLWAETGSIM